MAKRVDFSLDFSLDFPTTHISATRVSEKYLPSQIFDRLTRRYCACFHSTCSTRWPNGSSFSSIFCRVKNGVKNRVVWPGPKILLYTAASRGPSVVVPGENFQN